MERKMKTGYISDRYGESKKQKRVSDIGQSQIMVKELVDRHRNDYQSQYGNTTHLTPQFASVTGLRGIPTRKPPEAVSTLPLRTAFWTSNMKKLVYATSIRQGGCG